MRKLNSLVPTVREHLRLSLIIRSMQFFIFLLLVNCSSMLSAQSPAVPIAKNNEQRCCSTAHLPEDLRSSAAQTEDDIAGSRDEVCTVRLLVVYDPGHYPGGVTREEIASRAVAHVNLTNQILANSAVDNLVIQLAGTEAISHPSLNFNQSSRNLMDDAKAASQSASGDNLLEQLTAWRQSKNADITVYFLPERSEITQPINILGSTVAPPVGQTFLTTAKEAVSVVFDSERAEDFHTFPHEVAHIFGAGHNDASTTWARAKKITYFWFLKKDRVTIMYSKEESDENNQILHFSNPDIEFKNKPTGDSDRDNARRLRNRACAVSEFTENPSLPPFHITNFNAPSEACIGDNVFASAQTNQPNNTTYTWFSKIGNGPFIPHSSTQSAASFTMPNSSALIIKVVVDNGNGDSDDATRTIIVWPSNDPDGPCSEGGGDGDGGWERLANPSIEQFQLYPNPTEGNVFLTIKTAKNDSGDQIPTVEKYNIQLTNQAGHLIKRLKTVEFIGEESVLIDLTNLPTGFYIIEVLDENDRLIYADRLSKI